MERNFDRELREIPKIQADEKEDILLVQNRIQEAALEKIQKHLGGDTDPQFREWVNDTFELAAPNLQVNGIDYNIALKEKNGRVSLLVSFGIFRQGLMFQMFQQTNIQDMEPFNEELCLRVHDVRAQIEEATVKLTQRRKTLPDKVKDVIRELMTKQAISIDNVNFVDKKSVDEMEVEESSDDTRVIEQTSQTFDQSLSILEDLKKSVSGNLSRLERAQTVIMDINQYNS
ncbi:3300_t:CDS:2 [Acaulospora morrowiae]|uniref:3300_t:CDS:1 n=1 Tax=Acaulospora morrowiae TaxID=94023 RepID=A0A9N9CLL1_9GLOM|nr:3300_t:CDS:2 [Acaulospora morrowiae]